MTQFPEGIRFIYPWRKYQERVLEELQAHLHNNHLHVVAPPGSGKTVLGLEVTLRLNKPTLILAPTLAIRNQWIQRFCELFLQTNTVPDWISRDIRNPSFFTVVTYQALHAASNYLREPKQDEPEEEPTAQESSFASATSDKFLGEVLRKLKEQQVATIVVDEAHHLKNEWCKTLTALKDALQPTIVGLTATPPYDVTPQEWQRYLELNGPVDTEITVPELVVEGDLCPHQDYVYLSLPTQQEQHRLVEYRNKMQELFRELQQDQILQQALLQHPVYAAPLQHLEWIYANLPCYSASLIYLHACGYLLTEEHLEVIGDKTFAVPELTMEWMEILLSFYFYKDPNGFKAFKQHQDTLLKKLQRHGVLHRKTVTLRHNLRLNKLISASTSKLESILKIVQFEEAQLKQHLRMVVLTDYIRKEFWGMQTEQDQKLHKLGALPIFEKLRLHQEQPVKLGVLTGSLVILPKEAFHLLQEIALEQHLGQLLCTPYPNDDNYVVVQQTEALKNDLVHLVTQVFQQGGVQVLIGTKSLLGEGWDAPCINSLILASFVGSFVLSNQMRGRAIRSQRGNEGKTGNIWHLACVDTTAPGGGDEVALLSRRFRGFVGVSVDQSPTIQNGLLRLGLPYFLNSREQVEVVNERMLKQASQRGKLRQYWQEALERGISLVEEIKVPYEKTTSGRSYSKQKSIYLNKTIGWVFAELITGLSAYTLQSLVKLPKYLGSKKDLYLYGSMVLVTLMGVSGRELYKASRLYIRHRDIAKDFRNIGLALLSTLRQAGIIQTEANKLKLYAAVDDKGAVYCHLEGGTTFEKSCFISALEEIIGSVDNPRYVMVRKSLLHHVILQQDYHAVPELIGKNKALAEHFRNEWESKVGSCELIFTRNLEGRKLLLHARLHALSSALNEKFERVNVWR